ncbi:MAG: ABC transporter permease [Saprospiraceae bacterium]|nr:ABC transporter permease [Saprospiraceae bacterium]MCZ2339134.1 ABC transporter permease [Chitinophagales bacterium]
MKKSFSLKSGISWAASIIFLYIVVAMMAPFLANDKPIICLSNDHCLKAIIPYSPSSTDLKDGAALSPFEEQNIDSWRYRHLLGTDKIGRDVLAGMIHGTRISLLIGFLSVFFTFLLGTSSGMLAAYYKDEGIKVHGYQIILLAVTTFLGLFYLVYDAIFYGFNLWMFLWMVIMLFSINMFWVLAPPFRKKPGKYTLPIDAILMRIIELRKSFPGIFLLLAMVSIFVVPSVWNIIFIITLLGWTEFARHARAETFSVMETNYIKSAQILGISDFRILTRHILPVIMPTLAVLVCFGISGAILLESTLSFLGIGLPVEMVTWGKMMAEGRQMQHWWLVVFPGLAIFTIILSLNTVADYFQNRTQNG